MCVGGGIVQLYCRGTIELHNIIDRPVHACFWESRCPEREHVNTQMSIKVERWGILGAPRLPSLLGPHSSSHILRVLSSCPHIWQVP